MNDYTSSPQIFTMCPPDAGDWPRAGRPRGHSSPPCGADIGHSPEMNTEKEGAHWGGGRGGGAGKTLGNKSVVRMASFWQILWFQPLWSRRRPGCIPTMTVCPREPVPVRQLERTSHSRWAQFQGRRDTAFSPDDRKQRCCPGEMTLGRNSTTFTPGLGISVDNVIHVLWATEKVFCDQSPWETRTSSGAGAGCTWHWNNSL